MPTSTETITQPVLKLKPSVNSEERHLTASQLKKNQYSYRQRMDIVDPKQYEQAAALPKVDKKLILRRSAKFLEGGPYGDFRDDLIENGFAVVKAAVPKERAEDYEKKLQNSVKSFECSKDLDLNDPSTWVEKNLPAHTNNNVYPLYCSSHEKFMWDARQEQGVLDAFAKIWGTDELTVSFDGFNFSLPNRKDVPRSGAWPHTDQSPLKEGMQCVQGIINLSNATGPEDGSLMVFSGSHKVLEEFFEKETDKSTWNSRDVFVFTPAQLEWFEERGCRLMRVSAEPGDLILWDSRLIHYGGAPGPSSNQIRSVIYASYSPVEFATQEALAAKKQIFDKWKGTTHWAHDNIIERNYIPLTFDYKPDPEDRTEPFEKPEMTDKLLKLAGVLPY